MLLEFDFLQLSLTTIIRPLFRRPCCCRSREDDKHWTAVVFGLFDLLVGSIDFSVVAFVCFCCFGGNEGLPSETAATRFVTKPQKINYPSPLNNQIVISLMNKIDCCLVRVVVWWVALIVLHRTFLNVFMLARLQIQTQARNRTNLYYKLNCKP